MPTLDLVAYILLTSGRATAEHGQDQGLQASEVDARWQAPPDGASKDETRPSWTRTCPADHVQSQMVRAAAVRHLGRIVPGDLKVTADADQDDLLADPEGFGKGTARSLPLGRARKPTPTIAGLTPAWSSGVVEGHVNRVKTIKRAMYSRAAFALLRTRVLTQP